MSCYAAGAPNDRRRRLFRLWTVCCVLATAAAVVRPVPAAAAGALSRCDVGQLIVSDDGNQGQIITDGGKECLVKSADGRFQSWVPITQLRTAQKPAAAPAGPAAVPTTPVPMDEEVRVLRPMDLGNEVVFPADALGHVLLTAIVNDAPLHFLVDTGATLVALTPADAAAAGIQRNELTFDQTVQTAAGPAPAAFLELREIRIKQLEIDNVRAAVIENLKQSVLGMSFLSRLKGFELRNGALTLRW